MSQGQQNTIGGIVPKTRKVDRVELCESVCFGQVPLAPLCPLSATQALRSPGAPGHALSCSPAALNSTACALGSDGRPLPTRTQRASGARSKPNPCLAERLGDKNQTGPEPLGATCPSQAQQPQGGGTRSPAAEARTFTPTFCFASCLAWLWHRPGRGDPDTDFHRLEMLPLSPRGLDQLFGKLSSHPPR